jgi:hypothetical protein
MYNNKRIKRINKNRKRRYKKKCKRILISIPETFIHTKFRYLNTNLSRFIVNKWNNTGIPIYEITDELICDFIITIHPSVMQRISLESAIYIYRYLLNLDWSTNKTNSDIIYAYPYLSRKRIRNGIKISIESEQKIKKYKTINNQDTTCAICLDDIEHSDVVYKLKCSHVFHTHVEDWFANNNTCPLCRASVF